MFSPFKINHAGQVYYTNIFLREHHRFARHGKRYVYDVVTMAVQELPEPIGELIGRLRLSPGFLIDERSMVALRQLALVANEQRDASGGPGSAPPEIAEAPERRRPVTRIALFVAQKCNMKCTYCYGEGGEYSVAGMMKSETAFAAVDWLIKNSFTEPKIEIGFFGGEPLLNFKLMQRVTAYARECAAAAGKRVSFSLTTNGTLMSDSILDFLVAEDINPLVSYDGPYQDRQRPLTSGEGSHARVSANLVKLKDVFPHTRGRATLTRESDPFEVEKGMEEAGFRTCIISKVAPVLSRCEPTPETSPADMARSERMIDFTRFKIEKIFDAIKQRSLPEGNPPSILGDLKRMANGEKKVHACGVGKDGAGISASGDIYPCHRFVGLQDMRMGNIGDYDAGELNDYHRATVDTSPFCSRCWGRYLCGGGCMYENKAITGDLRRPNPGDCRERLAAFEDIGHVYARLDADDWTYIDDVVEHANRRAQAGAAPRRRAPADLVRIAGVV